MFTAGVDHTGQVFDLEANRVLASLNGHAKKVTGIVSGRPTAESQHVCKSCEIKHSSQTCNTLSAQYRTRALTCWALDADIKLLGRQDLVVTTSADRTVRLWKQGEGAGAAFACAAVLKDHGSDVAAATVHVTGDYFVTASLDKTWCFYDAATATCLQQVCCALLHPHRYPPQAEPPVQLERCSAQKQVLLQASNHSARVLAGILEPVAERKAGVCR